MSRRGGPSLAVVAAAAVLAVSAPASPRPRPIREYRLSCSELNGPPAPGIKGNEVSIGGTYGDEASTKRLWIDHADAFDGKDWDNFGPDSDHEKVVLVFEDKTLTLRSWHRTLERDARNVVTSRGVESAMGKDKAAILAADDPAYTRRRTAFDAIITECIEEGAKFQAKMRAEWPAKKKQAEDLRRDRAIKQTTQGVMLGIYFAGLLLALSLPWYGPLAMILSLAQKKSRSPLPWLAAALTLSPLGWASIDLRNVRAWMIPLSIAAPFIVPLLMKVLPAGSDDAPRAKGWSWGLRALIMGYALLSAQGAVRFVAYGMMSGSAERANLGNLGSVRSSLSIYYGDMEGAYPRDLTALMPKYLTELPEVKGLSRGNVIHLSSRKVKNFPGMQPDDAGGWGYVNEPLTPGGSPNPQYGNVFINCTHEDLRRGKRIADY